MAKTKTISLNNLLLNPENPRFTEVSSQKEALDLMIEDQGANLFSLAENIIMYGLNPTDRIQVLQSNHDPRKYIVLEGNRRVTALKLLHNPDSIEREAILKRKFKRLQADKNDSLPKSIECLVYEDPKETELWIGLKHGYGEPGVVTNTWGPLQKQRFSEKTEGKTSTAIQVINLMKKSPNVPDAVKANIEKISTTNLDRLISDPVVRDFLGIDLNNGIYQSFTEEKEVMKGLTYIVKDILHKDFSVKKIYSKDDRKDYIAAIPKSSVPNTSKKAEKPWQFNSSLPAVMPSPPPGKKVKVNPKDRITLIPKNCALQISIAKVNSLYHELSKIDINKYPITSAVNFRVFVELSIDSYLEINGLVTLSAAKSDLGLQQKINRVAEHMMVEGFADAAICYGIKSAIKDKNDLLSINTMHAYVHSNMFTPKPENLLITWDNIQAFMICLWNNTIEK